MTKEDIFKQFLKQELNGRDIYSPAVISYLTKEQTSAALSAMSIFAKQEAIAFLNWATENHSHDHEGFSLNRFNDNRMPTIFVKGQEITIEQLYDLFQSSQQSGGKEQVK